MDLDDYVESELADEVFEAACYLFSGQSIPRQTTEEDREAWSNLFPGTEMPTPIQQAKPRGPATVIKEGPEGREVWEHKK